MRRRGAGNVNTLKPQTRYESSTRYLVVPIDRATRWVYQEASTEHRLTKLRTPRTNGMIERFKGRIADVLKTHRFNTREEMEQTLMRYVALHNH